MASSAVTIARAPSYVLLIVALLLAASGCAQEGTGESGAAAESDAGARSDVGLHPDPADDPAIEGAFITSSLEIAESELVRMVQDEPSSVSESILENPRRFLELTDRVLELPWDRTVLVDKSTPLPERYAPPELVSLDALSDRLALSREGHRLTPAATDALLEMSAAAAAEGVTLVVSSTYRSYEYQADLFDRWVAELGQTEAELVSARPGTSQHQLGTTVDFGCICDEFADQRAGVWLAENARRYGFSLSYPEDARTITGYSYEPWHFRYIGPEATLLEREFFGGIQQWMLEFLAEHRPTLEAAGRT